MLKKRAFFIRLDVPEVEPDTYAFCLAAEDSVSGASSQIATDFIIQQEKTKKREK
jgi:hypothetical protein